MSLDLTRKKYVRAAVAVVVFTVLIFLIERHLLQYILMPKNHSGSLHRNKIVAKFRALKSSMDQIEEDTGPLRYITADKVEVESYTSHSKYGIPVTDNLHLVIYNRIQKSGGRTCVSLLRALRKRNGYSKMYDVPATAHPGHSQKKLDEFHGQLTELIDKTVNLPALVQGEFPYLNVSRFKQPVFINIIRDPLERTVSRYYFLRFGDGFRKTNQVYAFLNQTFDDCVLSGRDECTSVSKNAYMTFEFCGFSPRCRTASKWALEQAKKNVENYLLVGLTEDFESTLIMLEKLAPRLFKGLVKEYKQQIVGGQRKNTTKMTETRQKVPPSPKVRAIMREVLDIEYQFYYFVKAKFDELKLKLGISNSTSW